MKINENNNKTKTINIYHNSIGDISLHFLSLGDYQYISSLLKKDKLSYRKFTVKVIFNQLINSEYTIDEVNSWDDTLLIYIANEWLKRCVAGKEIDTKNHPYKNFYNALIQYQKEMSEKWKKLFASFNFTDISEAYKNVNESFNNISKSLVETMSNFNIFFKSIRAKQIELAKTMATISSSITNIVEASNLKDIITGFVSKLPDPVELKKHIKDIEEAERLLENKGFGFTNHLWKRSFIKEFNDIPDQVSDAVVTNKLLSITRKESFYEELIDLFNDYSILKGRKEIIDSAYSAHKNRNYLLSVPVLLTQIEGIINEMLILRGEAKLIEGKFYARNKDGSLKLNKNNNPIMLTGLKWKIDHSKFKNDEVLKGIANSLSDKLIFERNEILHGQGVNLIKPKLSTQCLLIIFVLSNELQYHLEN